MQAKIFTILLFFSFLSFAEAQEFPNLDFSDHIPSQGINNDPIGNNSTTAPWRLTHGSPLVSGSALCVYSGIPNDGSTGCITQPPSNMPASEGAYYPTTFYEGHKYIISFSVSAGGGADDMVDEVFIRLINGAQDQTDVSFNERTHCFIEPSDYKDIFYKTNYSTGGISSFINHTKVIYPDKDYSALWISSLDNEEGASTPGGSFLLSGFCVGNITIECCPDFADYHTTEKVIYPNHTTIQHDPLPQYTHVKNTITATADDGDIIIDESDSVDFRAGNEIHISATGGNEFHVEPNGYLHLAIEDCLCASTGTNICLDYIPPGSPPNSNNGGFEYIFVPNVFDPSGNNGEANKKFIVFYGAQYPMPYNAYRAEFRVFSGSGDLFHEQILLDECNGIPPGILFWDGCVGNTAAAIDVYTWTLELENCYASIILQGSVQNVGLASCP